VRYPNAVEQLPALTLLYCHYSSLVFIFEWPVTQQCLTRDVHPNAPRTQTITPAESGKVHSGSRSMFYALQQSRQRFLRFLTMNSCTVHAALLTVDSTTTIIGSATLGPASTACTVSHELCHEAPRRPLRRPQPLGAGPTSTPTIVVACCVAPSPQPRPRFCEMPPLPLSSAPMRVRSRCLGAGTERGIRRGPVAGEECVWGARVALEGGGIAC